MTIPVNPKQPPWQKYHDRPSQSQEDHPSQSWEGYSWATPFGKVTWDTMTIPANPRKGIARLPPLAKLPGIP